MKVLEEGRAKEGRCVERTLDAAIGVWTRGKLTYYVRRSEAMGNYPGVWSLFSERFDPDEVDPLDRADVQTVFQRMAFRRVGSGSVKVGRFLSARSRYTPKLGCTVKLWMYEIALERDPDLNPDFYSDGAWLTDDDFRQRAEAAPCGMCTLMWSDYLKRLGFITEPLTVLDRELDDDVG